MELRLYSFMHWYLSSIQQGIQTGHAAVDIVRKYRPENTGLVSSRNNVVEQITDVADWADNHKTWVILNGGDSDGLENVSTILATSGFPYTHFDESEGAMRGMRTCLVTVLPETIFNARQRVVSLKGIMPIYESTDLKTGGSIIYYPEDPNYKLIELLRSCSLAR